MTPLPVRPAQALDIQPPGAALADLAAWDILHWGAAEGLPRTLGVLDFNKGQVY